jgi:hypothetical protein
LNYQFKEVNLIYFIEIVIKYLKSIINNDGIGINGEEVKENGVDLLLKVNYIFINYLWLSLE